MAITWSYEVKTEQTNRRLNHLGTYYTMKEEWSWMEVVWIYGVGKRPTFQRKTIRKGRSGTNVSRLTFLDPLGFYSSVVYFILVNRSLKLLVWLFIALVIEFINVQTPVSENDFKTLIFNYKVVVNHCIWLKWIVWTRDGYGWL